MLTLEHSYITCARIQNGECTGDMYYAPHEMTSCCHVQGLVQSTMVDPVARRKSAYSAAT